MNEDKALRLKQKIDAWVDSTTGMFNISSIYRDLRVITPSGKSQVRNIMASKKEKGEVRALETMGDGWYVRGGETLNPMQLKKGRHPGKRIFWPFGLEKYARILPGNIVIVDGEKSAGKTSFLLNFIKQNMGAYSINYYSSEMGEDELSLRLQNFEDVDFEEWSFTPYPLPLDGDYGELIRKHPADIQVLDFIEVHKEHYITGHYIRLVMDALGDAIGVVTLQRSPGAYLPRGGSGVLENARMWLSLGKDYESKGNVLRVQDIKNWADDITESPAGLKIHYKILRGAKLVEAKRTWE